MGKHRRGQPRPAEPEERTQEDALWDAYVEAKAERGSDDTTTFDAFFDWWKAAT